MAENFTYGETMNPAVAGHLANTEGKLLISRTVETVAGVGFGKIVQQGAADGGCKDDLTGMTDQSFLGVTVRERSVTAEFPNGFAQYASARIMRKGVIWVDADAAVSPADTPTVTLATGAIGKTAVAAGIVAIPNARFDSSTAAAGLVKLRLG